MTTKKTNLSVYNPDMIPSGKDLRIGIVVSEWNTTITNSLLEGAYSTLVKHGVADENITVEHVPGSFELPTGAKFMFKYGKYDAVICLGCVIQGETRHFDFICDAVANAIAQLAMDENRPVIFGVLTTNDMQQAIDRSGGKHGNKGVEAAITALKMADMRIRMKKSTSK
ncbi:MAG: 6,7-dimethyl-8-ribityllumazine synthase [Bacteroidales bacterium]|nr:6,7-dimethyl-8-ribityllumazine synthase [Bacteroidales bacterium]